MKQVIFNFGELAITCNIPIDFCTIYKNGIPIWAGDHYQLIELLKSVNAPHTMKTLFQKDSKYFIRLKDGDQTP